MEFSDNRSVGAAGESLVRYRLLRWGWNVMLVEEGHPVDLFVYRPDRQAGFLRVQVKSVCGPRKPDHPGSGYAFHVTCRSVRSGRKAAYRQGEVDIFALVALDLERFVLRSYVPQVRKVTVPTHAFYGEDAAAQMDEMWRQKKTDEKDNDEKDG